MLMMNLTRAKYVLPIGGTYRQMKQYSLLAKQLGYNDNNILVMMVKSWNLIIAAKPNWAKNWR